MGKVIARVKTEVELLQHAIKKSGEDAYHSALSSGVTVTVLQGEVIQRIQPDGKRITIARISKTNNKVTSSRIRLK